MRAVLAAADPRVDLLAGQAEEIPADSSSFDVVIAQSAWHWVDESRAIPEVAGCCGPPAGSPSCRPVPTAPSTGCDRCGPEASSSTPRK